LSVIEDRKEASFFQCWSAPASRSAIVLAKYWAVPTLSTIQGLIFLIFAPFVRVTINAVQFMLVGVARIPGFRSRSPHCGSCHSLADDSNQAFHANHQFVLDSLWLCSPAHCSFEKRFRMDSGPDCSPTRSPMASKRTHACCSASPPGLKFIFRAGARYCSSRSFMFGLAS